MSSCIKLQVDVNFWTMIDNTFYVHMTMIMNRFIHCVLHNVNIFCYLNLDLNTQKSASWSVLWLKIIFILSLHCLISCCHVSLLQNFSFFLTLKSTPLEWTLYSVVVWQLMLILCTISFIIFSHFLQFRSFSISGFDFVSSVMFRTEIDLHFLYTISMKYSCC